MGKRNKGLLMTITRIKLYIIKKREVFLVGDRTRRNKARRDTATFCCYVVLSFSRYSLASISLFLLGGGYSCRGNRSCGLRRIIQEIKQIGSVFHDRIIFQISSCSITCHLSITIIIDHIEE